MAKRKRLTPAKNPALDPHTGVAPKTKSLGSHSFGMQPMTPRRPPIAQVAGDAATQAALEEVAAELRGAKTQGRLVLDLPLGAVDAAYLVRDRMEAADELNVLMDSLRARGQQTPIEVVDLGQGRYGLISGWRRLTALRLLHDLDGQGGFATVQALLRRPDTAADAYLAMVEENEIRVGLSYYERARIVARAAEQGVYRDHTAALTGLFGSVSRAKRSKIGSFLKLYTALDDRLRFPSAISERLGLALVKALAADPGQGAKLRDRLRKTPAQTAAEEVTALKRALLGRGQNHSLEPNRASKEPAADRSAIALTKTHNRVTLSGSGVTAEFVAELEAWLAARR